MNAAQQALIDLLAECGPIDFPDLQQIVHARKYTGPITIHFFNGTPTSLGLDVDPVHVRLDQKPLTRTSALDTPPTP